ncbi:MAG: T9SS type A sorting domain-containing protein [Bacteroidales bacterium]|nr:T9SS type A sorting domain-containing protein [Bacteroidales bacterium]
MKKTLSLLALLLAATTATAQLKPRPDAFPPQAAATPGRKAVQMASTVAEMAAWDRYPTYPVYVEMMQRWASDYPDICSLDTIGTSIQGRLILALHIEGNRQQEILRPEFFYTSTIHGDEVTGYAMMLRLIDTLLTSYGHSPRLTALVDGTAIYINPLANPDGTYRMGNHTVQGAMRYNADYVDLNRTFPDPFSPTAKALPQENAAMIAYTNAHRFRLSANLHGGSEVANYPWDSFTSADRPHPESDWWKAVCRRFVDTCRAVDNGYLRDVADEGYIAGGDWYVIGGGRQDYMNYYHDCLELTLEISSEKTPPAAQLPAFWRRLRSALLNYIEEIYSLPGSASARTADGDTPTLSPNPTHGPIAVEGLAEGARLTLCDMTGRTLLAATAHGGRATLDLGALPHGIYLLHADGKTQKVVKR